MPMSAFEIVPGVNVGRDEKLLLMAGPCVIESEDVCREIAVHMKTLCEELGISYVFKASFDKANRTSIDSFRGPGMDRGLEILEGIRRDLQIPVLTDVHDPTQASVVGEVVDVLQIPAFLCRQTDLLVAAGNTGKVVNVKKGQFLAPDDMKAVVKKVLSTGNERIMLTERGATFGYHNLVVDMRSLVQMAQLDLPVVFDCTHAVQLPGGQGNTSGGQREFVFPLARAAAAVGIQGLFMEVHPNPAEARSDGANSLPLNQVKNVLQKVKEIHELVR